MEFSVKSERGFKVIALSLLLILVGSIYLLFPEVCAELWRVVTSGSMNDTIEYIQSFGAYAILFSFFLDVLVNAVGFLPSIFISTANGILFGIIVGVVVSWLAETTGVVISFFLMRFILRDSAEKLIRKSSYLTKLDELSGKNGFKVMAIARMLPYFPSGILTALGAVSRMSARDYILANLAGKFPSTALEVIIGHDAVLFREHMDRLAGVVLLVCVVYGGIWVWRRRSG